MFNTNGFNNTFISPNRNFAGQTFPALPIEGIAPAITNTIHLLNLLGVGL